MSHGSACLKLLFTQASAVQQRLLALAASSDTTPLMHALGDNGAPLGIRLCQSVIDQLVPTCATT